MELESIYEIFLKHPKVSTDSRKIEQGSLFFALKGENFDGNKYAADSLEKGAAYAIVDDPGLADHDHVILVKDVLTTLQALAGHHRLKLDIPIIGLTGSNGKTTTKELMHAVLSKKYNCIATIGNLNNHIGVPLTLLRMTDQHELAIIEMGANHVDEIAFLSRIASPNFGLITNIGKAHIGEFGGFDKIIQGKTELYTAIASSQGKLFVNGNDSLLMEKSKDIDRLTYGESSTDNTEGNYHSQDPFLNVKWQGEDVVIKTQLVGKYNTDNVLAAVAIGEYFKVPKDKIKQALEEYTPTNNRSQIQKTEKNTLIMDAYNANPSSVEVAIENLVAMETRNKYFILGDMLELGNDSPKEHQGIYDLVVENSLQGIFVGPEFQRVFKDRDGLLSYASTKEALAAISKMNLTNKLILLKGSRGMRLETLCPAI